MPLSETEEKIPALSSPVPTPLWIDLLHLLWSRRRSIAKWVLLGLLLSALMAWRAGKFSATAQIMPPDSSSGGMSGLLPLLAGKSGLSPAVLGLAGDAMGVRSSSALFAKVLQSRVVEDSLIERFHLRQVYGRRYNVDARRDLEAATLIDEDRKSGVLAVTVKDKDPALARDLANAYVDELNLVLTKTSTSSARREREFIEQRLQEEKKAMSDAEEKLSKFSSGTMALDVPEQIRITVESSARLQGELIAARSELEGLQQIYTPENVRVKSARARVGELEQALARLNGAPGAPRSQDPSYPYPSVKALPALSVEWTNLYRDSKIHETVFEMLTSQYEMARIQEAKEIPSAKLLDPAVLPEKRYPRPVWVLFGGAWASFFIACVGVVLKDRWEAWDEADPKRILLSSIYFGTRNRLNRLRSVFRRRQPSGESVP